jgi:hypothetical protein
MFARRAFVVCASIVLIAGAALAQDFQALAHTTPEQRAEVQTALMKEKLGLDAAQLAKVQAINLETAQKMEPVIKGSERPLVRMRQAQAIDEQRTEALRAILTPPQLETYLASKEAMRQKLRERLAQKSSGGGS